MYRLLVSYVVLDVPTSKFGDALRAQVEERLNFFETGAPPSKNADAIRRVLDDLALEDGDEDADEEMADAEPILTTLEPTPRKEKKKKRKSDAMDVDEDDEGHSSKKVKLSKEEKKALKRAKKEKKEAKKALSDVSVIVCLVYVSYSYHYSTRMSPKRRKRKRKRRRARHNEPSRISCSARSLSYLLHILRLREILLYIHHVATCYTNRYRITMRGIKYNIYSHR